MASHSSTPRDYRGSPWLLVTICAVLLLYRVAVIAHLDLDLYVDEAYYWHWAQALDWGYYSKPPLIAGLIAVSGELLGDTPYAVKAPSLVLYPATALVVRQLGTELFDRRVGFWSGLAFLTLPITAALGLFASTDAPLVFFWALGMWLLWRALVHGGTWRWIAVGVAAGLGLMSKYTMIAFVASAFLAVLAHPDGRRQLGRAGPWVGVLVASLIFLPNLIWNAQHGFATFRHTSEITGVGAIEWRPAELVEFIGAQWLSFGPVLTVCLLMVLFRARLPWADPRLRFLLVFTVPLLGLGCLLAVTGGANGNWAAPAFVGASIAAIGLAAECGRWRLAILAVAFNFVAGVAVYHWPDVVRLAGRELTGHNDPYKRARGWRQLAAAVRPQLEAHPDAVLVSDNRELLAQLIHGLRPLRHARWQPDPHAPDHYGLTVPLEPGTRAAVLFVSKDDVGDAAARFATARKLEDIDVAVYPDFHRRVSVWLLQGFEGY